MIYTYIYVFLYFVVGDYECILLPAAVVGCLHTPTSSHIWVNVQTCMESREKQWAQKAAVVIIPKWSNGFSSFSMYNSKKPW